MYKFPASKLACELPSAGYIQLRERASRWVRAFSDPGPETQGSPGAHMAATERNVMWLCVNGGQKILPLGLTTGASPTIAKVTHKVKACIYATANTLTASPRFPFHTSQLSSVSLTGEGQMPAVFSFSASSTLNPKNGCYFFFFKAREQSNTSPKASFSSIYSYTVIGA